MIEVKQIVGVTLSPVKPAQLQDSHKKKPPLKAQEYSSTQRMSYLITTERERQFRLFDTFPGVLS